MEQAEAHLRRDALRIFKAGLQAADASRAVHKYLTVKGNRLYAGDLWLDLDSFDRISLVAVGKAAASMAHAVEEILSDRLSAGVVVTKHGHSRQLLHRSNVIESGHPLPDEAGEKAAHSVEALVRDLDHRDLLLVAVSGGASALLPAPARPVTLAMKQATTDLLLSAGANIRELNTVRKHLSFLKGGRLAKLAHRATVVSLLLSDVVGDGLDVIGSGLTAPDETTFKDALAVLGRFDLLERVPLAVRDYLESGAAGGVSETPKAEEFATWNVRNIVIGSNRLALEAAARQAQQLGYRPLILSSSIEGETREIASRHARILRESVASGHPLPPPSCILSGGETVVTVRGAGKGGRNQEFALAAALDLAELENVLVLSAGTDGSDGPTDAAGAIATGKTIARAEKIGLKASEYLARNDSYHFFAALNDLVRTGPTGTNVMDVHILLAGTTGS